MSLRDWIANKLFVGGTGKEIKAVSNDLVFIDENNAAGVTLSALASTTPSTEVVQDVVGAMVSASGGLTATYTDSSGNLDIKITDGTSGGAPLVWSGSAWTNSALALNDADAISGALPDTALSTNVVLKDQEQVFTDPGVGGTAFTGGTLCIKPTSVQAITDTQFGIGVGNTEKFRIDATGDVWAHKYNGDGSALTGISGGVTDHGALTGLSDDDHTQYLLKTAGTANPLTGTLRQQYAADRTVDMGVNSSGQLVITTNYNYADVIITNDLQVQGSLVGTLTGTADNANLLASQNGAYYLNATNINAGVLSDSCLSTNVALKTGNNVFARTATLGGDSESWPNGNSFALTIAQNGHSLTGYSIASALVTECYCTGTGTTAKAVGNFIRVFAQNSAVITNAYGAYICDGVEQTSGSIGTLYGIYLEPQTAGGTANYGIYVDGAATTSHIAGKLSVGTQFVLPTTAPSSPVSGSLYFDQANTGLKIWSTDDNQWHIVVEW